VFQPGKKGIAHLMSKTDPIATAGGGSPFPAADDHLTGLPEFTRSLLKVKVQVCVTVASARRPISQILEIGPGSILQFDRHFESPLVVEANGEPIAEGIAVRAGDHFGVQITEMKLPPERFWSVQPPSATQPTTAQPTP
jgi:flagellar motor switch/type III secretory pathway protein FliN